MMFKRVIPTFLLALVISLSYGQEKITKRGFAKAVSSESVKKSSLNLVNKKRNQTKSQKHKLISGKDMPLDFPQYKDTGNKENDMVVFRAAKLKWINDNPEKYKSLFRKEETK